MTISDKTDGSEFQRIAANIPLVTVIPAERFFSGRFFPKDGRLSDELPNLCVAWLGKTDATAGLEELCGLDDPEPQRYFYVGRADMGFGEMAFAYDASIDNRKGDVTPFDSGELWRASWSLPI